LTRPADEIADLEQVIDGHLPEPRKKGPARKKAAFEKEIRKGMQDIVKALKKIDRALSSMSHILKSKNK
jgi:hypothetical protein